MQTFVSGDVQGSYSADVWWDASIVDLNGLVAIDAITDNGIPEITVSRVFEDYTSIFKFLSAQNGQINYITGGTWDNIPNKLESYSLNGNLVGTIYESTSVSLGYEDTWEIGTLPDENFASDIFRSREEIHYVLICEVDNALYAVSSICYERDQANMAKNAVIFFTL